MKLHWALLVTALTTGTSAAKADDIFAKYFSGVNGGEPCYARSYDDAHLKAHPKQTVRRIEVDFDVNWRENESSKNSAADFQAGMSFMLKRSNEWYGQELYCKVSGSAFECYLDADGGRIRLIPAGTALRLEVVSRGGENAIAVEGAKDFGEFGAPGGDDRVFILPRADRKICDVTTKQ